MHALNYFNRALMCYKTHQFDVSSTARDHCRTWHETIL